VQCDVVRPAYTLLRRRMMEAPWLSDDPVGFAGEGHAPTATGARRTRNTVYIGWRRRASLSRRSRIESDRGRLADTRSVQYSWRSHACQSHTDKVTPVHRATYTKSATGVNAGCTPVVGRTQELTGYGGMDARFR
jgi:hypothetical protein